MFNRVATALSRDGNFTSGENKILVLGIIAALMFVSLTLIESSDDSDGAISKVEIDADKTAVLKNSAIHLEAKPTGAEGDVTYTWSSSPSGVVNLSATSGSKITATGAKAGTATITVVAKEGETSKTASVSVTIVELTLSNINVNVGETKKLTFSVQPSSVTVTFTSSDTGKATVTNDGSVTGVAQGTSTITMKASVGTNLQATCTATVTYVPVEKLTWDGTATTKTATMNTGKTLSLTVQIAPATASCKEIVWTTSDSSKATVTGSTTTATVKAESAGQVTITATAKNETTVKATCTITISDIKIEKLELDDKEIIVEVGRTFDEDYTITPSDATIVTEKWVSSDPAVFKVNEKTGVIEGVRPGTGTLTLTVSNTQGSMNATCKVTVPETYSVYAHYTLDSQNNATVDNIDATIKELNEAVTVKHLDPILVIYTDKSEKITIPTKLIEELKKLDGQLEMDLKLGAVLLEPGAVDDLDISGTTTGISFTQIPKETYPKFGDCFVYSISMLKDGAAVETKFDSTPAKIAIYHKPLAGEDITKLKAAYVYGDGDAVKINKYSFNTEKGEGAVIIEAPHMSVFMFMFHDSEYISTAGINTTLAIVFLVIVVILAAGIAFFTFNENASEKLQNLFKRNNTKRPPMSPPGQNPYGYYPGNQFNGYGNNYNNYNNNNDNNNYR